MDFYNFDPKELMRGFIVGYAKLVSVKEYCSKEEFLMDMDKHLSISEPKRYPLYGFVLEDVHRIKPIEGYAGFF